MDRWEPRRLTRAEQAIVDAAWANYEARRGEEDRAIATLRAELEMWNAGVCE